MCIRDSPYASLDGRKSIFESIAEPLQVQKIYQNKKEMEEKVYELMATAGLARRLANSYPHELDGGRRQRVGIARALALNPDFLVLDEPVSALDVSIQAQVLNLMEQLQEQMGLTYLFISHDLSVVKHISDEIAVMYLGQIVEKAECKDLFKHPSHPYTPVSYTHLCVIFPVSANVHTYSCSFKFIDHSSPFSLFYHTNIRKTNYFNNFN